MSNKGCQICCIYTRSHCDYCIQLFLIYKSICRIFVREAYILNTRHNFASRVDYATTALPATETLSIQASPHSTHRLGTTV